MFIAILNFTEHVTVPSGHVTTIKMTKSTRKWQKNN